MRTLLFDQDEFDGPGSEESLEVIISKRKGYPHPTVEEFAAKVFKLRGDQLPQPIPFLRTSEFAGNAWYLTHFGGLTVPDGCDWPCFVLADEWNHRHVILDRGDAFISMRWSTTA